MKGVQSMYPVVVTVYSSIDSVMMSVVNEICKKSRYSNKSCIGGKNGQYRQGRLML